MRTFFANMENADMGILAEPPRISTKTIGTYAELRAFLRGFKAGKINLMVLVGSHGVGKSRIAHEILNGNGCWIEGNSTALGIYSLLHKHKDKPIVIDDVDSIFSDAKAVRLLKALCQTEPRKRITWTARGTFLRTEGLPPEFETSSRVMIICNDWRTLNRNVAAVEDRGLMLRFEPSPREVHEQARAWFRDRDPEIYDWLGTQVGRMKRHHSLRLYLRAAELKACGIEWRDILDYGVKASRKAILAEILADPTFETMEDEIKAFISRGGGGRTSFFKYRRKIEEERQAAAIAAAMPKRKPGRPRKEAPEEIPPADPPAPKIDRKALAEEIARDGSFATTEDRVRAFNERCGGSQSSYYYYYNKLDGMPKLRRGRPRKRIEAGEL